MTVDLDRGSGFCLGWRDRAACSGDHPGASWFAELSPAQMPAAYEAARVCDSCPVRWECFSLARKAGERYGRWGGVVFDAPMNDRRLDYPCELCGKRCTGMHMRFCWDCYRYAERSGVDRKLNRLSIYNGTQRKIWPRTGVCEWPQCRAVIDGDQRYCPRHTKESVDLPACTECDRVLVCEPGPVCSVCRFEPTRVPFHAVIRTEVSGVRSSD